MLHVWPSVEKLILTTPLAAVPGSIAERFNVTDVVDVIEAPELILIVPVGIIVSFLITIAAAVFISPAKFLAPILNVLSPSFARFSVVDQFVLALFAITSVPLTKIDVFACFVPEIVTVD